mgnify:CR=1 FL=1
MKKSFCLFLLSFAILFSVGCDAIGDGSTSLSDLKKTSTSQAELTSSENTEPAETTATLKAEAWQPNLSPWNISPYYQRDDATPQDYILNLNAEPSVFSITEIPEYIRVTIFNEAGKQFWFISNFQLEKKYTIVKEENVSPLISASNYFVWCRIPYARNANFEAGYTARADLPYLIDLKDESSWYENYELTPGEYRFVFYSAVGTHYAYFEITE